MASNIWKLSQNCQKQVGVVRGVFRTIHAGNSRQGLSKLPRGQHSFPESQEQVEVSRAEWSFVERLFPYQGIPEPEASPGEVMPSGWIAPSAKPGDYPYFVPRSANHMVPVYLYHQPILSKFITTVKHVEGDTFALGEEIKNYLTPIAAPKPILLRVHEPHQKIQVKGQYVQEIQEFLLQKGF